MSFFFAYFSYFLRKSLICFSGDFLNLFLKQKLNESESLDYDKELLYKNMVEAKAEWLYTLEAWNTLIPDENRRKELYKEQKSAHTVVKDKKVSRNEPCPCGSGKKYKFCCGR